MQRMASHLDTAPHWNRVSRASPDQVAGGGGGGLRCLHVHMGGVRQ